jgi:hypothetical protein
MNTPPLARLRAQLRNAGVVALLLELSACGQSGEPAMSESKLRPFPYVVSECGYGEQGWTARQQLHIRQTDGSDVIAKEITLPPRDGLAPFCWLFGATAPSSAPAFLPFQRLGVSRDGSTVAFG